MSWREMEFATLPRPSEPAEAHAGDGDGSSVLVLGGCIALGWGVFTHDLALPGALARAHASATGRGTRVRVIADLRLGPRAALRRLDSIDIAQYDTIVLTLGWYRALRLASLRTWRRDLSRLIDKLQEVAGADTRILVAGIHPIRAIALLDSPLGVVADSHARAMNRITAGVCQPFSNVAFVPITTRDAHDPGRIRTAADYRHYGELLAARMTAPGPAVTPVPSGE